MKIAFFSNCYLPYLSGVTLSIKTLAEELRRLGHSVYIVAPQYPKTLNDPFLLHFPSLPAPYPGYRLVLPFSANIYRQQFDLVHVHQPFGVGLAALFFAKKLKVPLVYTFHTLFTRYAHHLPIIPAGLAKPLLARYLAFFCNQTDAVVAPSTMVKRYLKALGVKSRIEVIPTGVPIEKIENRKPACRQAGSKIDIRKKLGLPSDGKILLFSGRISGEKNIPFLLNAFPVIQAQCPDVYFVLVGSGPKQKEYQSLACRLRPEGPQPEGQAGIVGSKHHRIIFTGQVNHPDIYAYYQAADLFVYSSLTETQGLVLAEAKAGGLPIVALFAGGLVDVVESGLDGYLIPRNEAVFVEHVVRLLRDDLLRAKMSGRALADARERFSAIVVAKQMETLYNSLINRGPLNDK